MRVHTDARPVRRWSQGSDGTSRRLAAAAGGTDGEQRLPELDASHGSDAGSGRELADIFHARLPPWERVPRTAGHPQPTDGQGVDGVGVEPRHD